MQLKEYEKVSSILAVLLLQTIIILWLTLNVYLRDVEGSYPIPSIAVRIPAFLAIGLTAVSIKMIKRLVTMAKAEIDAEVYKIELERSKELISSLRAQRHDFCTYLNVITGLIQLGRADRAIEYITDVAKNMREVGPITEFEEHSILNALLLTKKSIALNEGIDFSLDFQTDLHKVKLVEHKLARVLGNIIDNAIEALKEGSSPDRRLRVEVRRRGRSMIFIVWNNGPAIPRDKLSRIFEEGYSTKSGVGRGVGLSIVKALVDEMGGRVSVMSDLKEGTRFIVSVPFSLKEEEVV